MLRRVLKRIDAENRKKINKVGRSNRAPRDSHKAYVTSATVSCGTSR